LNKQLKIINEVYFWKEKLKVPFFILNFGYHKKFAAWVNCGKKKMPVLTLNMRYLRKQKPVDIICIVFHEFGHIYHETYRKNISEMRSEFLAESYMIKKIKKFIPKIYKSLCKARIEDLLNEIWKKGYPNHYKAFKKIYLK